jgi:hypothetical protein
MGTLKNIIQQYIVNIPSAREGEKEFKVEREFPTSECGSVDCWSDKLL